MSPEVDVCKDRHIVLDSYAILPGTTLFSELVRTSLLKLGYSPGEALGAKGTCPSPDGTPMFRVLYSPPPPISKQGKLVTVQLGVGGGPGK